MARVWISPRSKHYSTTREAAHLELAKNLVREHGLRKERLEQTPSQVLLANGWVRVTETNVEGDVNAFYNNWDLITTFFESELTRVGKDHPSYIDITDRYGKVTRSTRVPLGELTFMTSQEMLRLVDPHRGGEGVTFGRRRTVRVRPYRRRRSEVDIPQNL